MILSLAFEDPKEGQIEKLKDPMPPKFNSFLPQCSPEVFQFLRRNNVGNHVLFTYGDAYYDHNVLEVPVHSMMNFLTIMAVGTIMEDIYSRRWLGLLDLVMNLGEHICFCF
jgi:hypothetical protein